MRAERRSPGVYLLEELMDDQPMAQLVEYNYIEVTETVMDYSYALLAIILRV